MFGITIQLLRARYSSAPIRSAFENINEKTTLRDTNVVNARCSWDVPFVEWDSKENQNGQSISPKNTANNVKSVINGCVILTSWCCIRHKIAPIESCTIVICVPLRLLESENWSHILLIVIRRTNVTIAVDCSNLKACATFTWRVTVRCGTISLSIALEVAPPSIFQNVSNATVADWPLCRNMASSSTWR